MALGPSAAAAKPTPPPATASPETTAAINGAQHSPAPYPSFRHLKPKPSGLRSVAAWKGAITDVKTTGQQMFARAATQPWTLADTTAWAAKEREEATPPPPITTASDAATDAAVAAMRERAKEPPRSR
ncbi:MAG TPA: hypothetical protein VMU37_02250 [Caulobacteraceae bacterium]|nr:hypothetical protein [Caulobacteraceae bacterium]